MAQTIVGPSAATFTQHDVDFYRAFGFVVFRNFFTRDELKTINREFDHAMREQYAHKPYDGSARHWSMMLEGDTPFFGGMMEDPRFMDFAKATYGDDVLGICSDANRYTGDTGWHRDTTTVHQYGVKFAFYLDAVDADTGALRVVSGSHAFPDDAPFNTLMRNFKIAEVPSHVCKSEPGDVVAFDLRTWHASCGGGRDRRMCTVVFYANPKTPEQTQAVLTQSANNPKIAFKQFGCKRKYLYSKSWLANPNANPDRQRWIDRLSEMGYFAPPGVIEGGPALV